jgi:hypothetical protein
MRGSVWLFFILLLTVVLLTYAATAARIRNPKEPFTGEENSILSDFGAALLDNRCRIEAAGGASHVMKLFSGLMRHPSRPNTCFFRTIAGNGRIVATDECMPGSEIHDDAVVEEMSKQSVLGSTRCVVKLRPGLAPDAYDAYDAALQEKAIERTDRFTALVVKITEEKADMMDNGEDRDDSTAGLVTATQARRTAHGILVTNYDELEKSLNKATEIGDILTAQAESATATMSKRDEWKQQAAAKKPQAEVKQQELAAARAAADAAPATLEAKKQDVANRRAKESTVAASCKSGEAERRASNASKAVYYPPSMSDYTLNVNGDVYIAKSSTERIHGKLAAWMPFDGKHSADTYTKWQSTDACYDNTQRATWSAPFDDGHNDMSYPGQWVQIQLPFPIYITAYQLAGDMTDHRLYAKSEAQPWTVLDQRQSSHGWSAISTYHLPSVSQPYTKFAVKIGRSRQEPGYGRASMMWFRVRGYRD